MELQTNDGPVPVLNPHDHAVRRPRRDLQAIGQRCCFHGQRMIPADAQRAGQRGECPAIVVKRLRRAAVDGFGRSQDASAEGLGDDLVAQTDAQQRNFGVQAAHHLERTTRLLGVQGPGESTTASGRMARTCATPIASLRTTTVGWPSRSK